MKKIGQLHKLYSCPILMCHKTSLMRSHHQRLPSRGAGAEGD